MTHPLFKHTDGELPAPFGAVRVVEIEIPGGVATPEAFAAAVHAAGALFHPAGRGIVLSGRAPVWGYAMALHAAHPARWVATMDPRLEGAVVVQTHVPGLESATLLPLQTLQRIGVSIT